MAKNLMIIGNGFDLDLGLKTSYFDYIKNTSGFTNSNIVTNNKLFQALCTECEKKNWIDAELFIKEYVIKLSKKELVNENITKEFEEIRRDLCGYIDADIWPSEWNQKMGNLYNLNNNAGKVFEAVVKNGNFEILSFNYTSTDSLVRKTNISNKLICKHVHGTTDEFKIVFGADDDNEISDDYSFILKSVQKRESHFIEQKLSEASHIIIFGHSLGTTDYHYFSRFFQNQSNSLLQGFTSKTIYVFTKSRRDIYSNLRKMDKSISYQRLRDINDFRLFTPNDKSEVRDICEDIEKW